MCPDTLDREMTTELIQTIMTTHIHFALLLAFPQIFGLRWTTMLASCVLILVCLLNQTTPSRHSTPLCMHGVSYREEWCVHCVCLLNQSLFGALWRLFPSALLFFPPGYVGCIIFFVVSEPAAAFTVHTNPFTPGG